MSEPVILLETVGVWGGRAPLLGLHQDRLDRSSAALGVRSVELAPPLGRDGIVSCRVTGGVVSYGWRPRPAPVPVRLATAPGRLAPYPHKTSDRRQFEAATAWARTQGADEGLILSPGGLVAESGIWAVCWWEGQVLAGPPLTMGILPSVARRWLVGRGVELVEHELSRAGIGGRSLLLANAARGVVEVESLDGDPVPRHPGTVALAASFRS